MITVRPSDQRGKANFGWLDSRHSFSFGNYYDPEHMGFSTLRVINEDLVEGGAGFPTHSHRDMEIITYVLEGSVEHQDSLGNHTIIKEGEIQRMTAGTGIAHSEFNPSPDKSVHFLQIWILPAQKGLKPSYQQQSIDINKMQGNLSLLVSPDGQDGSLSVHQDINLYASHLLPGQEINYSIKPQRNIWIQLTSGHLIVNGIELKSGDGAAISQERSLLLKSEEQTEILLFDLN